MHKAWPTCLAWLQSQKNVHTKKSGINATKHAHDACTHPCGVFDFYIIQSFTQVCMFCSERFEHTACGGERHERYRLKFLPLFHPLQQMQNSCFRHSHLCHLQARKYLQAQGFKPINHLFVQYLASSWMHRWDPRASLRTMGVCWYQAKTLWSYACMLVSCTVFFSNTTKLMHVWVRSTNQPQQWAIFSSQSEAETSSPMTVGILRPFSTRDAWKLLGFPGLQVRVTDWWRLWLPYARLRSSNPCLKAEP